MFRETLRIIYGWWPARAGRPGHQSHIFYFLFLSCTIAGCGGCAPFHWGPENSEAELRESHGGSVNKDLDLRKLNSDTHVPELTWPLPSRYSMRDGFNPNRERHHRKHLGIDFPAPKRTPIFAAHDGWITYTGRKFHGYGLMVIIDNGKGYQTLYAHMNQIKARQGTAVHRGDTIGEVGATGHAHGSHLHFELMHESIPVNPVAYLTSRNKDSAPGSSRDLANQR